MGSSVDTFRVGIDIEGLAADETEQRDAEQQQLQVVNEGREEHQDGAEACVCYRLTGPHLLVFDLNGRDIDRG